MLRGARSAREGLRDRRGLVDDQTKNQAEKPLRKTGGDDDCQSEDGREDEDFHVTPCYRQRIERH